MCTNNISVGQHRHLIVASLSILFCCAQLASADADSAPIILGVASETLNRGSVDAGEDQADVLEQKLGKVTERYTLALVLWSLLQPQGAQESEMSRRVESAYWAALRSLARTKTPEGRKYAGLLVANCALKGGDLVKALEMIYAGDPVGFDLAIKQHGIRRPDDPRAAPYK